MFISYANSSLYYHIVDRLISDHYLCLQVVQEEEEVTLETMTTAADALDKLSESDDVTITDTTMTTVVEVANTINLNSDVQADKEAEAKTATK